MADGQHGGYRRPANPAPVSGPGAASRRTDGGPAQQAAKYISGLEYGGGQELMDVQTSAPMSAAPEPGAPPPVEGPVATPFDAPTERPGEPVTAGAPFGAGPGPEVYGPPQVSLPPDIFAEAARMAWVADPGSETLRLLELVEMIEENR